MLFKSINKKINDVFLRVITFVSKRASRCNHLFISLIQSGCQLIRREKKNRDRWVTLPEPPRLIHGSLKPEKKSWPTGLLHSGQARFDARRTSNVQTSVVVTYYPHPASTFPLIAALRRNRCPCPSSRRSSQLPPKFLFYWLTSRVHEYTPIRGTKSSELFEGYRVKYRPPFLQLPFSPRVGKPSFSPRIGAR